MSSNNPKIQKFKSLDPAIQELLQKAADVRNFAYCPYSQFKVGACVLTDDGAFYGGCNVENGAYPVGNCAERTAYCKAVSEGKQKFKAVAVVAFQKNSFTSPCGNCRQFMSEFGNVDVYLAKPELDNVFTTNLDTLLPEQYKSDE